MNKQIAILITALAFFSSSIFTMDDPSAEQRRGDSARLAIFFASFEHYKTKVKQNGSASDFLTYIPDIKNRYYSNVNLWFRFPSIPPRNIDCSGNIENMLLNKHDIEFLNAIKSTADSIYKKELNYDITPKYADDEHPGLDVISCYIGWTIRRSLDEDVKSTGENIYLKSEEQNGNFIGVIFKTDQDIPEKLFFHLLTYQSCIQD